MSDWFIQVIGQDAAKHHEHAGDLLHKHVLVIDADKRSRAWYRNEVRRIGHEVDEAGDVSAAISFLEQHREAVVLAHLSTLLDTERSRLQDFLAHHPEFSMVTTTTTPGYDPTSAEEQDTARILVRAVNPDSGGS